VKVSKPPVVVLPHTGAALPIGPTVAGAIGLLGLGLLLVAAGRRRTSWLPRR
jgi:LPXTG-motif cell wall-anchored protein